ncbi:MAG: hypothetical protein JWN12_835 [Candidatus Saccharibacteria bacterium]|nr:hypothetical protein [Candidatus Saccharibacteria bacterium]
MDQKSTPNSEVPTQTTSPEEDSALLAIEALEARTIDPDPRPLNAPRETSVPPRPTPMPTASPKVIEPVITQPITPTLKPDVTPKPVVVAPKPKQPSTPSEEMAEELEAAPATSSFQFFANQKPPRKPFIIIGIVVVIAGIGVAAYFATR